jgi:Zn-finger nucleic acid-binding protein
MKCPVDGEMLLLSERSGIEIDYCPTCRGVWLDRGELDKIIDRSLTQAPTAANASAVNPRDRSPSNRSGHHGGSGHDGNGYSGKRRGGWLGDLFGD